eukprot:6199531-Pleurochrysis_carterae.AAC.3
MGLRLTAAKLALMMRTYAAAMMSAGLPANLNRRAACKPQLRQRIRVLVHACVRARLYYYAKLRVCLNECMHTRMHACMCACNAAVRASENGKQRNT